MSAAYQTSADIANRALQHCDATPLDPTLGLLDGTPKATQLAEAYDKVREYELRRNAWTFAIKKATLRPIDNNTMLLVPTLWSSTVSYYQGSIVVDQYNNPWISLIQGNLGNDPTQTSVWEPYYGPMSVSLYDSSGSTAYGAGELVYTAAGNGTVKVYLSLISANSDVPSTGTAWSASTTYFKGQVVTFSSVAYQSLIDFNINNEPDTNSFAAWAIATTYSIGQKVTGSDGKTYTSLANSNLGNNPVTDGGVHWSTTGLPTPWTTSFVGGSGSLNWLEIGGSDFPAGVGLTTMGIIYPIGAGPSTQSWNKNVFRLPAGYLRMANQNPKETTPWGGGPSGVQYNDYVPENQFMTSWCPSPITLRFVANVTDVRRMDAMFCEGFAASLGLATVGPITQSNSRKSEIAAEYLRWMGEARTVNAIEQGWEDSPDDDWITARY